VQAAGPRELFHALNLSKCQALHPAKQREFIVAGGNVTD